MLRPRTVLAAIIAWNCAAVTAAAEPCDLALSLAIDASSSISTEQRDLIRRGTAGALRNPEVLAAFAGNTVYVEVFEWSDRQAVLQEWTLITGPDDLYDLAQRLEAAEQQVPSRGTSLRNAMRFARASFERVQCDRYVLDILTDGEPNSSPVEARNSFDIDRHQINVLFVGERPEALERMAAEVQFGWGTFVMDVPDFANIELGMVRKLRREVAMNTPDGRRG